MRMLRSIFLLVALFIVMAGGWLARESPPGSSRSTPTADDARLHTPARAGDTSGLPGEAWATLRLIEAGGPFPYDRDGNVFQNREGRLPSRPRGFYREYTVVTPGSQDRGARRIVSGGDPPTVFYYSDDHYRTFRRLEADSR